MIQVDRNELGHIYLIFCFLCQIEPTEIKFFLFHMKKII